MNHSSTISTCGNKGSFECLQQSVDLLVATQVQQRAVDGIHILYEHGGGWKRGRYPQTDSQSGN